MAHKCTYIAVAAKVAAAAAEFPDVTGVVMKYVFEHTFTRKKHYPTFYPLSNSFFFPRNGLQ